MDLDPGASWLDLELVRAEVGAPTEVGGEAEAGTGVGPFITDFSDEDGTGADEVRTTVLLAYGPRWSGTRLPS